MLLREQPQELPKECRAETGQTLNEVLQFFLQFLSCKEDAAFYSSEGKPEAFGNFAVFESGNMHGEGHFIIARQ